MNKIPILIFQDEPFVIDDPANLPTVLCEHEQHNPFLEMRANASTKEKQFLIDLLPNLFIYVEYLVDVDNIFKVIKSRIISSKLTEKEIKDYKQSMQGKGMLANALIKLL